MSWGRIWGYHVLDLPTRGGYFPVQLPLGAELLTADVRGEHELMIWAVVDLDERKTESRRIRVYEPDLDIPPLQSMRFLGMVTHVEKPAGHPIVRRYFVFTD